MIKLETMQQQHHEALEPSSSSSFSISPSPSFSSYSSETLAEIAARVIQELRRDPHSISDDDEALFHPYQNDDEEPEHNIPQNDDDDDEFEFAFVSNTSPVSADDIFYNGQIKPMYPIFDRTLLLNDAVSSVNNKNNEPPPRRRRLPLRKLMFEESAETASCSSSTDESSVDLEGLAEGSYCVWNPNSVGIERKKSSSTGSGGSKRWKLRNLMLRSQSDGKEKQPVMFQIPAGKGGAAVEHGGEKEKSKRKSLLPYKPELVGLFSNVNGLGRNLNPF